MIKLNKQQTEELEAMLISLNNKHGFGILAQQCSFKSCGTIYGLKNGYGKAGISSGYCPECFKRVMDEIKNRKDMSK